MYITSNDDVTTNPKWIEGATLDANGGTGDDKTGVIVVVNKDDGVVDAFYFYYFAYNWGGVVLGKQLGKSLLGLGWVCADGIEVIMSETGKMDKQIQLCED